MGRELKRVPLDFNWPLKKTWGGFINPYYKHCPDCNNGVTPARERLSDLVNLLMISGSDSLKGENHPYFGYMVNGVYGRWGNPSKDMIDLTEGLAGRKKDGFGHDAIDRWTAEKKIIEVAGLTEDWGICPTCKGEGMDPAFKEAYEAWKETPVPEGEGYQLWENTSEGSPMSPVFKTLEDLCEWCAPNASVFGTATMISKERWFSMLSKDFVTYQDGNVVFI